MLVRQSGSAVSASDEQLQNVKSLMLVRPAGSAVSASDEQPPFLPVSASFAAASAARGAAALRKLADMMLADVSVPRTPTMEKSRYTMKSARKWRRSGCCEHGGQR